MKNSSSAPPIPSEPPTLPTSSTPEIVPALENHWMRSNLSLLRWSFVRHRYLFAAFTIVQLVFSFAIIYGLTLLMGEVTEIGQERIIIAVAELGIIVIGCTISPQLLSQSIEEGLLEYQRTLPVPRASLLFSDFFIWILVTLPGILLAFLAGAAKFKLVPDLNILLIVAILVALICFLSWGYFMSLQLPGGAATVIGQIILFVGMLFTPIMYSSDKLPSLVVTIHEYLPILPTHNILTGLAFPEIASGVDVRDYIVVIVWTLLGLGGSTFSLLKRK